MDEPWYADGLRFECTRCGKCCSGFPGYVWVNQDELQAIAELRQEPLEEVIGLYTRAVHGRRSLRDTLKDDCIFFSDETGCTIYAARPRQCRTWPFWESNLESEETWTETEGRCPGAGRGSLIPVEEITRRMREIRI